VPPLEIRQPLQQGRRVGTAGEGDEQRLTRLERRDLGEEPIERFGDLEPLALTG